MADGQLPTNSDPQATAQQGLDVINQLMMKQQAISKEIAGTLPAAMGGVKASGVSKPTLPGSFEFGASQPQFAAPQGHKDAVRQGVAKTISGIINIVGQAKKAKDDQDTRVLSGQIQKVMSAQDQISQAQQVPKDDPGYKDAQALIAKNKQIINDTIGHDPKTTKKFQKAFDINFVDPSQNDSPEHKALGQASKSYADQLAAKTPDKLVPNAQAINKVKQLQAQQQEVQEQIKAYVPLINQQAKDATTLAVANQSNQTKALIADQTNQARVAEASIRGNAEVQSAQTRAKGTTAAASIQANAHLQAAKYTADKRYDQALDTVTKRVQTLKETGGDPVKMKALNIQAARIGQAQLKDISNQINAASVLRDKANKDPAKQAQLNKQIQDLEAQRGTLTQQLDGFYKTGEWKGVEDNNANQPERSTAGPQDDSDEHDYTNPNDPIYN